MGKTIAGISAYSSSLPSMPHSGASITSPKVPSFTSKTKSYDPNTTMSKFQKKHDSQPSNPSGKDMGQIQAVTGSTSSLSDISDRRILDVHIRGK
jgi:hypothetical protein